MPVLGLHTSAAVPSIAIRDENGHVFERIGLGENSHLEEVPGLITALLKESAVPRATISKVVIGSGPGSFTGLRIGYSIAKGLAHSLRIPVEHISSLAAIAYEERTRANTLASISDARRSELFLAVYRVDEQARLTELLEPTIIAAKELDGVIANVIGQHEANEACVVSDQAGLISRSRYAICHSAHAARSLIELSNHSPPDGKGAPIDSLAFLEPEYLRRVAAKTVAERLAEDPKK